MKLIIFFLFVVASLPAQAQNCGLLPASFKLQDFRGYTNFETDDLLLFTPARGRFPEKPDFTAIGAIKDPNGCLRFPDNQSLLYLNNDTLVETNVINAPVDIRLVTPKKFGSDKRLYVKNALQNLFNPLANLFPHAPSGLYADTPYTVVVGFNDLADAILSAESGPTMGFVHSNPDAPAFEFEVAQLLADMMVLHRKNPQAGPSLDADTPVSQYLDGSTYAAIVGSWLGLKHAYRENLSHKISYLYTRMMDYETYLNEQPQETDKRFKNWDPALNGQNNPDLLNNWDGTMPERKVDAYFMKYVAAHMQLANALYLLNGTGAPLDIAEYFKEVHAVADTSLYEQLKPHTNYLEYQEMWSPPKPAERFDQILTEGYFKSGVFNIPEPLNKFLFSQGRELDIAFFVRKNRTATTRRIFVITHSDVFESHYTNLSAFDFMALPLVKKLIPKGDVAVLHRGNYGGTENALSESLGDCTVFDYEWGATSAALHMNDTADWLRARSYDIITLITSEVGAFGALAALERQSYDDAVLLDPWRGYRKDGQCGGDAIVQVMRENVADNHVPFTLLGMEGNITQTAVADAFNQVFQQGVKKRYRFNHRYPAWLWPYIQPHTWVDDELKRLKGR